MSEGRAPCRRVAFVDDDADLRRANVQSIELAGYEPVACASAAEALSRVDADFEGVVVSDLRMPGMDGLQLFAALRERDPELPVLLITGHGDVPTAVKAIQDGAYDFLTKPYAAETLLLSLGRALDQRSLALDNRRLRQDAERAAATSALIGVSSETERLRKTIDQVGPADIDILIEGETGTGKSLVAALLHRASARVRRPMVTLDAGALPEAMAEGELFGHVAGAFTGVQHSRTGRIMSAEHGTLFLDNIDALPLTIQPKLLQSIEERVVVPLGTNEAHPVDVRIIAASSADLGERVREGRFLDALYYRLNAITLRLPPLRERREDIPLLFEHFLTEAATRHRRSRPDITAADWARFHDYSWPGNAREVRNRAERTVLDIDEHEESSAGLEMAPLPARVAQFEAAQIHDALTKANGNTAAAINSLKIPRKTFYDKLKRYDIKPREWRNSHSR